MPLWCTLHWPGMETNFGNRSTTIILYKPSQIISLTWKRLQMYSSLCFLIWNVKVGISRCTNALKSRKSSLPLHRTSRPNYTDSNCTWNCDFSETKSRGIIVSHHNKLGCASSAIDMKNSKKSSLTLHRNATELFLNDTRLEMKFQLRNIQKRTFLSSLSKNREETQALASLATHLKASNEKGHRLPHTWYSTSWKFPGTVSSSQKPQAAAKSITLSACLILSFFKGKFNGCDIK